jgi:hypothetical protein
VAATRRTREVVTRMGIRAPRREELSGAAMVRMVLTPTRAVVRRRPGRATARNGRHQMKYQS